MSWYNSDNTKTEESELPIPLFKDKEIEELPQGHTCELYFDILYWAKADENELFVRNYLAKFNVEILELDQDRIDGYGMKPDIPVVKVCIRKL